MAPVWLGRLCGSTDFTVVLRGVVIGARVVVGCKTVAQGRGLKKPKQVKAQGAAAGPPGESALSRCRVGLSPSQQGVQPSSRLQLLGLLPWSAPFEGIHLGYYPCPPPPNMKVLALNRLFHHAVVMILRHIPRNANVDSRIA